MTATLAPARVAATMDARHAVLVQRVAASLTVVDSLIAQGDAAAARDLLAELAPVTAERDAIRAAMVTR